MNYKVLYRKYRPQDFDSIVGQEFTINLLKTCVRDNKIGHAYIFTGPRGTGKTSTARIFAKAINCLNLKDGNPCNECEQCNNFSSNPDIIEIDAASNNGVDQIRELINNVRLASTSSKYKVYIIDEFHMLSTSAFNALLLTLEEPPVNVVFILATTDIQNVPITILSRCERYDFKFISYKQIEDYLKEICKKEKINITDEAISEISYLSSGSLRDALSLLDQISIVDEEITTETVTNMFGGVSNKIINEFINYIDKQDIDNIDEMLNKFRDDGVSFKVFVNKLIENLKNELLAIHRHKYEKTMDESDLYNLILEVNNCLNSTKNSFDPYSILMVAIIKCINNFKQPINKVYSVEKASDEIKKQVISEKEKNETIEDEKKKNIVEQEKISNNSLQIKEIRINNCFANAKKETLNKYKEKWDDFINYEANANKAIMSFILDTNIVAAADDYAIITHKSISTATLLNENIKSFEKDFKIFYGVSCRFIALSDDEWEKVKNNYINNLKNNVKYNVITEDEIISKSEQQKKNDKDLEVFAEEIFGEVVEVK